MGSQIVSREVAVRHVSPLTYVSPFDERVRPPSRSRRARRASSGRRVALLDIPKNRGAEFLDRIETLLQAAGRGHGRASPRRSSPSPPRRPLIDDIAGRADLVVEAPRRLRLMHVVQFA